MRVKLATACGLIPCSAVIGVYVHIGFVMRIYPRCFSIALAILPVVAGTALGSGPALFVCRGDSIARATCCCPESQHRAPGPMSAPTVSSACCCDISGVSVPSIPAVLDAEAPTSVAHHPDLVTTAGAPIVAPLWSLAALPMFLPAQPPPRAVPLLLCKQSLLI